MQFDQLRRREFLGVLAGAAAAWPLAARTQQPAVIYTDTHRPEMLDFAKTEFPTASEDDLKAQFLKCFR